MKKAWMRGIFIPFLSLGIWVYSTALQGDLRDNPFDAEIRSSPREPILKAQPIPLWAKPVSPGTVRVNGPLEDVRLWIQDLAHCDSEIRLAARTSLLKTGRKATPQLIDALRDPNPRIRYGAAYVLGDMRDARAVPTLIETVRDPDSSVASSAVMALRAFRDPRTVQQLIQALSQSAEFARASMAYLLGQTGDSRAVPALLQATDDPSPIVGKQAIRALRALRDSHAAEVDPDPGKLITDPPASVEFPGKFSFSAFPCTEN